MDEATGVLIWAIYTGWIYELPWSVCGIYSRFVQAPDFSSFHRHIRQLSRGANHYFLRLGPQCNVGYGYETKYPGEDYRMKGWRGGAAQPSRVLFQFTLDGAGLYSDSKRTWRLESGEGFLTLHPSAYRYELCEDSPWSLFWLTVRHPVFVQRIRRLRQTEDAVQTWPLGSPALHAVVELFDALCRKRVGDIWDFERLLFAWLWAMERELYLRRYPRKDVEWLDDIRARVMGALERPPGVPELAAEYQMERTTFSRKFKAATGVSPAAFVMEVRLQEAMKLLHGPASLAEIAYATGFADATHFSKAFHRHFGLPPGAQRDLMGV